jgi:hypothetical protein
MQDENYAIQFDKSKEKKRMKYLPSKNWIRVWFIEKEKCFQCIYVLFLFFRDWLNQRLTLKNHSSL